MDDATGDAVPIAKCDADLFLAFLEDLRELTFSLPQGIMDAMERLEAAMNPPTQNDTD